MTSYLLIRNQLKKEAKTHRYRFLSLSRSLMVSSSVSVSPSCSHFSLLTPNRRNLSCFHKCNVSSLYHLSKNRHSLRIHCSTKWKLSAGTKQSHTLMHKNEDDRFPTEHKYQSLQREESILPSCFSNAICISLLVGFLALQGSEMANASTEIGVIQQPFEFLGDLGDLSTGFASAFLLIFFSELGDKTFFIAALLAARNSGAIVFVGTFGALAAMTVISVVLGRAFHYVDFIIPFRFGDSDFPVDDFAAACLLIYFGVTTLLDAASGGDSKMNEEQEEAEIAVSKFGGNGAGIMATASTVISTFVLVFIAEWGDKSFFSTIALAAASSPLGVIGGSLAGHAVATLIAVLGGSLLGKVLSEKVISYVGGTLFLVFAAVTLVDIVR